LPHALAQLGDGSEPRCADLPFTVTEVAVIAARIARGETKTALVRRMPGDATRRRRAFVLSYAGIAAPPNDKQELIDVYRQQASRYDLAVRLFDSLAWFGFNLSGWRKQAVSGLGLRVGDTVVDIGCGTGLNFPLLYSAVGPQGTIIAVDLSDAMLAQARKLADTNQWANVQLVCADAAQFKFPPRVHAILSTYALTLVPEPERGVSNAAEALAPAGRLVVLDMAWPRYCPLWWRPIRFFLCSYGVTADVLKRRPWDTVQRAIEHHLSHVLRRQLWLGFFSLAAGAVPSSVQGAASHRVRPTNASLCSAAGLGC
jgi:demethylmenaquinone methyltransferase/2-methoxy-6-polyprenyl-1,4-benzoquinol methylase